MRTCSDDSLKSVVKKEVIVSGDSVQEITTDDEYSLSIAEKARDYTFSFYALSILSLDNFEWKELADGTFWALFGFTLILVFSIFILYFSFKNKFRIICRLALASIFLLFISTLILWSMEIIVNSNQLKTGYYLFAINLAAIIYLSHKVSPQKKTEILDTA